MEYASGDCWYVDFETEEQAQGAFRYIRETLQTFKGKRIMVCAFQHDLFDID